MQSVAIFWLISDCTVRVLKGKIINFQQCPSSQKPLCDAGSGLFLFICSLQVYITNAFLHECIVLCTPHWTLIMSISRGPQGTCRTAVSFIERVGTGIWHMTDRTATGLTACTWCSLSHSTHCRLGRAGCFSLGNAANSQPLPKLALWAILIAT